MDPQAEGPSTFQLSVADLVRGTADWRRRKAEEYDRDARNLRCAEALDDLAAHVLALPAVAGIGHPTGPVTVRARRSATAAHYEKGGVIAVPDRLTADWAMRELVVLHELAHHLCDPDAPAHGPDFVATFCALASAVMGPEAGHVLRVVYAKEGVR